MAAQIRVIRQRVKSTQSIKKITRAQELIAASRIVKARRRVRAAKPYADEITRVVTALASKSSTKHPLLVPREQVRKAGVLVVTSDRAQCGGYNANVLRATENLVAELRGKGVEPVLFVIGRKGVKYYTFRERAMRENWTGFSELPKFEDAKMVGDALTAAFVPAEGQESGEVDELYLVSTEFESMISQKPAVHRIAPLALAETADEGESKGPQAAYEFEPDAETLLAALLPKYVNTRIFAALLESAASEQASRQQAMKSATDNAEELIRELSRAANAARQAQITQEISEIVGGANALAAAGSDD